MLRSLRGLRVQLLLWAIVPLMIIVVGVAVLGMIVHQTSMRDLVTQRDAQLAGVAADLLDERLLLHIRLLEVVAERGEPLPDLPEFDGGLLWLDREGNTVASSPAQADWKRRGEWVTEALDSVNERDEPYVSNPFMDPLTRRRALFVAIPLPKGQALLGLASFSHLGLPTMIDALGTGQRGTTSLVNGEGTVIYHPDPDEEGQDISHREGISDIEPGERGAIIHHEPNGEEMVFGYAPSRFADWRVVIHEPWADAIAPVMRVSQMTPIIVLLTAVAALLVIFFGMRYIIRPLQVLEQEATRAAWGDFKATEESLGGVEEIESLRRTLNLMTSRIQEYQVALHDYLTAVTRAEEHERLRLAHELHDDTVQNLIALVHRVEMCEKATGKPDLLARRLDETRDLATQMLESTRRLIQNLRPAYLEDLGLAAAIDGFAADLTQQHGIPHVKFTVVGEAQRLDLDVEFAAFRIVQEALTNVVRHARATSAEVRLEFGNGELIITVRDDGTGFSAPETPHQMTHEGHFGLMGIHERALRFGGHLSMQSNVGHGTTLVATIPCSPPCPGRSNSPESIPIP